MDKDKDCGLELPKGAVIFVSVLALAGFCVALYLTWLHHQVHTDPHFHSFCAMSDSFNCETVAESPWSVFLGLPVSVWGMLAYAFMFFTAAYGLEKRTIQFAFPALLLAASASVVTSIILAFVSYCVICSFCLMCSITYGINLALLFVLVFYAIRLKFSLKTAAARIRSVLSANRAAFLVSGIAVFLLAIFYPKYWVKPDMAAHQEQISGVTPDGHHWTGGNDAKLVIVEFSDYICPHCRRAHAYQRKLLSLNPGKIKLIHRHFPLDDACNPVLDTPFHPGACLMAQAAICAGRQGKFWEMNDYLFPNSRSVAQDTRKNIESAAAGIVRDMAAFRQCLDSPGSKDELSKDINEGLQLKLNGTPSFVIDGKVHVGTIDPHIFKSRGISLPEQRKHHH